jgi:SAM-dependent methyltransferase
MSDAQSFGREYLTEKQYKTDANLAARQSIYRYQHPRDELWGRCLDLAGLHGDERVLDVGCGNGSYLAALARRDHRGPVIGMDLSRGMLEAANARKGSAVLVQGEAEFLPFPDDAFELVLAMHMLYHVADRPRGIGELRRVLKPGGVALVVTNSEMHMHELDEVARAAAGMSLPSNRLTFTLESGARELAGAFVSVERHEFGSELLITEVDPVLDYVASMRAFVADDRFTPVIGEVRERVTATIAREGVFRVRTAAGCFVCR